MDLNHDGVINMKDINFSELKVWIDGNHDGISQASELHSLQSLNISQLNLNATQTAVNNNDNWIFQDSTFTSTDGTVHQMADVWFQTASSADIAALSTDQIASLTTEQVHALTTDQIHAMSSSQVAAMTTADIVVLTDDQVKALTSDDIAALQNLGKNDVFTAQQQHAMIKPHLVQGMDDILFSGQVDVHTNVVAGTDHIQTIITGDATAHVDLVGSHGDWKDVGSMLVNGVEHHVYNNGSAEILIQGTVTTTVKDVLIG
jgi:hypothetical protein